MRAQAVGADAVLLECADLAEVRAVYAEALRRRADGDLICVDVVPAAASVLLDGLADRERVLGTIGDWRPRPEDVAQQAVVEIPVVYDGPDLPAVAARWGMSEDEAARRHRELDHVVAFCGFSPGFAYVAGLPEELAVPRLAEPRSSVPAGSVGLAGAMTGIYPRTSPGGWQLIGRTEAPLWDLRRDPPALLVPGTRVRFVDA